MRRNRGRHVSRWESSRWRRKVLGVPIVGWVLGVATTALAVVGFVVLLGTSGNVGSAGAIDVYYASGGDPQATPVAGALTTCQAARIDEANMELSFNGALPGSACEFSVWINNRASASSAARLQGFNLDSPAFASGDIRATVAECGQTIPVDAQGNVTFTIWVDGLEPGSNLLFNPSLDGLEWVAEALYDPADCVQT